jgi:hypothetical protein
MYPRAGAFAAVMVEQRSRWLTAAALTLGAVLAGCGAPSDGGAGTPPLPDAALPPLPDAALPPLPDAALPPLPDAALPPLPAALPDALRCSPTLRRRLCRSTPRRIPTPLGRPCRTPRCRRTLRCRPSRATCASSRAFSRWGARRTNSGATTMKHSTP